MDHVLIMLVLVVAAAPWHVQDVTVERAVKQGVDTAGAFLTLGTHCCKKVMTTWIAFSTRHLRKQANLEAQI